MQWNGAVCRGFLASFCECEHQPRRAVLVAGVLHSGNHVFVTFAATCANDVVTTVFFALKSSDCVRNTGFRATGSRQLCGAKLGRRFGLALRHETSCTRKRLKL